MESLSQSARVASGRSFSNVGSWIDSIISLDDFVVDPKNADPESMKRWRKMSLALNACRRFRYTANLEKRESNLTPLQRFRVGGIAIEAVRKFKAGISAVPKEGFQISTDELVSLINKSDTNVLREYGGLDGVSSLLLTDLQHGIKSADQEINRRVVAFGSNTYTEKPKKSFLSFLFDATQDVTLIILAVCAAVSLIVGLSTEGLAEGWYDGVGIALSVVIVVFVTASSDYQQSLQFQDLDAEKRKVFVEVIRAGVRQKLSIFDLVVGDIVFLSIGDIIPADGLFIDGHSLLIDESSMTGESEPVHIDPEQPFLKAGCKVQDGSARLLVTGVGMKTQWGNLMASLSESGEDETPLQVRLSGVATLVGNIGLVVAILVFTVLIVRYLIDIDFTFNGSSLVQIVKFFSIAVTIIVVAVPEGLPLAVTLTLAFAMKRMMADKALVRHLAACETMGSATTICSDKTGTLTTNKMTVVRMWIGGAVTTPQAAAEGNLSDKLMHVLKENVFLNTAGDVVDGNNILGSPTETAILAMATELKGDFKQMRSSCKLVAVETFNSKRKRMGVVVHSVSGKYRVHWKGAAEIVLAQCVKAAGGAGELVDMEGSLLVDVINSFAADSLRTMSLAYRELRPDEIPEDGVWPDDRPLPFDSLTLLCIVGIKDPLRPGVTQSVRLCQSAGIMVRMVTGDNLTTAKAIAKECGIFTDGIAIEGSVFRELSVEKMREIIPSIQVMARSSPSDKLTLVKELRAMGEVVAVTGDGTNDAPALKESDIGLAMGIAGTEVAKDSADIVVLDDNFATIVQVAKWGRSVYNNIQKFVQFQLTVNIVALVVNFVSACITGQAPLTAVQLLWVNLIMDTLGALALATEAPDDALMLNPPVGRTSPLITPVMWRNVAGQATYQLLVLALLEWQGMAWLDLQGEEGHAILNTLIFNAFVFCQVFNEFNSRDMERMNVFHNLWSNQLFVGIITITVLFQILLVENLGAFASTVPLSLHMWILSVAIGFASMPIAAVVKQIQVPPAVYPRASNREDGYHQLPDNEGENV